MKKSYPKTESQKLRAKIPVGDVWLAKWCLANKLPYGRVLAWRKGYSILDYWFPYMTLLKVVEAIARGKGPR